jgi:hypothetical protein
MNVTGTAHTLTVTANNPTATVRTLRRLMSGLPFLQPNGSGPAGPEPFDSNPRCS